MTQEEIQDRIEVLFVLTDDPPDYELLADEFYDDEIGDLNYAAVAKNDEA